MKFECVCEPKYIIQLGVPWCPVCLRAWYDLLGTWKRAQKKMMAEEELMAEGRQYAGRHKAVLLPWAQEEQVRASRNRANLYRRARKGGMCILNAPCVETSAQS